jgi:hypothetical protein
MPRSTPCLFIRFLPFRAPPADGDSPGRNLAGHFPEFGKLPESKTAKGKSARPIKRLTGDLVRFGKNRRTQAAPFPNDSRASRSGARIGMAFKRAGVLRRSS